ncbi:MAG TPA: autotransporter domain-containing protein [Bradyrhizobium sp.]|uniref:autotransporter domain-containing protein n=1 Tax=Bradyrhizobium sp. TaxID=376 RepID=UPI002C1DDF3E|nr:autotransporter domain-containing protein [Bradyrhizobium sp.]HTA99592.1 autotransporter domain-containing protein [Bradyrhizobium sp.]
MQLSLATSLATICLGAVPTHAQTTNWTGGTGSWFVNGNWSNGVPSSIEGQINVTNGGTAQINGGVANGGVGSTLSITNAGSTVDLQAGGSLFTGTLNINNGGTLLLSGSTAVTTANGINLGGGTLESATTGSIGNNIKFQPNVTSTVAAAAGQTLTLSGSVFDLTINNPHLVFGSATNTGTVVIAASILSFGNGQATIDVAGGTLRAGNSSLGSITGLTPTTVHAGATLDFNDQAGSVLGNLLGDGRVLIGTNSTSTLSIFKGNFSGQISGSGQLGISGSSSDTLTLSGPNDYTGGTTISSGTLQLAGAGTLGNIGNALTMSTNIGMFFPPGPAIPNILDLGGSTQTQNGGVTLITGTIQHGALSSSGLFDVRSGTVSATLTGSGALTKSTTGTVTLSGPNSYTGGTSVNAGVLEASHATAGAIDALGTNTVVLNGGTLRSTVSGQLANGLSFANGATGTFSVAATQTVTTTGFLTFSDNSVARFGSATDTGTVVIGPPGGIFISPSSQLEVNGGTLRSAAGSSFLSSLTGANASTTVATAATLDFNDQMSPSSGGINNLLGSGLVVTGTNATTDLRIASGTFAGEIAGAGSVHVSNFFPATFNGTLLLTGANSYTGGTFIDANHVLQIGNGGATGSIIGDVANNGMFAINRDNAYAFAGVISGNGALQQNGSGNTILTGANTYVGPTSVNAGTLSVSGSIAPSSMTTVNTGGELSGSGIVGNTVINGGIFMPGNGTPGSAMTVAGNLAFQSGSLYLIQLNPAASTFASVTGTASLNGNVGALFLPGNYVAKQYTIVSAAGGVNGSFNSLVNTNLPSSFAANLSYDANDAYLNVELALSQLPGLNGNQRNVANALSRFFNTSGGIPLVFGTLTPAGLTQASGETATGSQQTTFDAMTQFLSLLLDPFVAGRGDNTASTTSTTPFAEEGASSAYASSGRKGSGAERDAYGMMTKAAPRNNLFDPHWSIWAAGFGGSQTTDGNTTLGSNGTTSSVFGTAVGADYFFSPRTIAGFSLAGGGTNFSVANGGSGRSDLFQAGAFVRHTVGASYVSGALAYGWQDITTNRTVTVAGIDQLQARFNANAFSGRAEGGYRLVTPWMGVTPYAAAQFTTFDLPTYAEQAIVGSNTFALAYNARSVTDTRSELGIRTDKSFAMQNAILTLRGRFAWAHDFNPDRSIAATFQALPGASFVVNGAAQASDSALTTASAEMKWINGWSVAVTFEGEFSDVTRSYAGKGVVRYTW